MNIYKIAPEDIPEYWKHIRPFLDAALNKYGVNERFPIDFVLMDLLLGKSQGWAIIDNDKVVSAVVTEVEKYPLGDVLILFLMGGESMSDWGDMLHDAMVVHAKEIGAKWMDTGSRRGIGKLYYDRWGYTRKYETYSFEVTE
jgi:hypothetical protein